LNAQQISESQLQQNLVQEAAEYYFFKDGELSHVDKQHIIRSIVREIQAFGIKSRCSAFKFPEK